MNAKLKTLIQALIDEVNEVKGVNDTKGSSDNWWKLVDWKEADMRTAFDSLSENTRQLIIDEGLCPDCPEKKDEFPKPPEGEAPCEEKLKKEHPDWTPEQCAEKCKEMSEEDKKKAEESPKEAELTPEEKKKKEEEEAAKLEAEKKKFPPKKKDALDPYEVLKRADRVLNRVK